jgi:hypothetical protein
MHRFYVQCTDSTHNAPILTYKHLQGHLALLERTDAFFETHQLMLSPTTCVAAFDKRMRYLKTINGIELCSYVSRELMFVACTFLRVVVPRRVLESDSCYTWAYV